VLSEADLPFLRLASAMPILNYGLFTDQICLDYPISHADHALLNDLLGFSAATYSSISW
jgi:hypothetical protein